MTTFRGSRTRRFVGLSGNVTSVPRDPLFPPSQRLNVFCFDLSEFARGIIQAERNILNAEEALLGGRGGYRSYGHGGFDDPHYHGGNGGYGRGHGHGGGFDDGYPHGYGYGYGYGDARGYHSRF